MKYIVQRFFTDQSGVVAFVFAGIMSAFGLAAISGIEYASIVSQRTKVNNISQEAALKVLKDKPQTPQQAQLIADEYVEVALAGNDKLQNIGVLTDLLKDEVTVTIEASLLTLGSTVSGRATVDVKASSTAKLNTPQIDINIVYDNSLSMNLPLEDTETPLIEYASGVKCYFACHMDAETLVYQPEYVSKYDVVQDNMQSLMESLRKYDTDENIRTSIARFSDTLVIEHNIESYIHKDQSTPDLHQTLDTSHTDIQKSLELLQENINTDDDIQDIVVLISDGDNRQTEEAYSFSACESLKAQDVIIYTIQLPVSLKRYNNPDAIQRHPWSPGYLMYYDYDEEVITDKVSKPIYFFGMNFGDIYYNGTDNAKSLMQECATSKRHYTEVNDIDDIEKAFEKLMKFHATKHAIIKR